MDNGSEGARTGGEDGEVRGKEEQIVGLSKPGQRYTSTWGGMTHCSTETVIQIMNHREREGEGGSERERERECRRWETEAYC